MAEILTTQAELDEVFARLEKDYGALNNRQQAYAIDEIGRVRSEVTELLAEYADGEGVVQRQQMNRILSDLDVVESNLRQTGELTFEHIVKETSEYTTARLAPVIGVSASAVMGVNQHVLQYVTRRFGEDGLVLSDRVWGLSGEIRDELSTVIRSSIIKGEGINAMIPKIRKVYDNETWKIRRLARTESVTAHRAAISYNAQESEVVEWLQFHHGVKRTDACVNLANHDKYGKGKGVYKTTDTEIWMPHPNCTSYATYILDERWL